MIRISAAGVLARLVEARPYTGGIASSPPYRHVLTCSGFRGICEKSVVCTELVYEGVRLLFLEFA